MLIKLTKGYFAIVDDGAFDYLSQWRWKYTNGYAVRNVAITKRDKMGKRKYKTIFMHRLLNNTPEGYDTDHVNRDKLDNRICNLRTVTRSKNKHNATKYVTNKSGVKGVYWRGDINKWEAQITSNYKSRKLGCYKSIEEASKARKRAELLML